MPKKPLPLMNAFQGAKNAQENATLRDRIAQLEAEKQLPLSQSVSEPEVAAHVAVVEEMTAEIVSELTDLGGIKAIALADIFPDPDQPRKTFTESIIQERVESLRQFGQQSPIIVIAQDDGRFKLFDGEVRWRAASRLNWATLKAVLLPITEVPSADDVFEGQIVTGIHSQRLHDLDLAEGLIYLGTRRYPSLVDKAEDIPKILNTAVRRLDRDKKLSEMSELRVAPPRVQEEWLQTNEFKDPAERDLFALIFRYKLNPTSINSHVFPLLKLFVDIKLAIRQDGLESSKARELNKLSPEKLGLGDEPTYQLRTALTQKVLTQKLSLSKVKQFVHELIKQQIPIGAKDEKKPSLQLVKILKDTAIDMDSPENLQLLLKALQDKVAEVKDLLS
jgi:ParB family transcriptional regulator, chromosome partitioning protein